MSEHKIGRPTESKKDAVIKVRVDNKTSEKLELCAVKANLSKSEIVRIGIDRVYDEIIGECTKCDL